MKMPSLFVLLLIASTSFCQEEEQYYTVVAPSGLSLRDGPGLEHNRISALPFGTQVDPNSEEGFIYWSEDQDTIDQRVGSWLPVATESGEEGYLFSGYLKNGPLFIPSTEINDEYRIEGPGLHCEPVNYDPDMHWYAFQFDMEKGEVSLQTVSTSLDFSTVLDPEEMEFAYAGAGDYVNLNIDSYDGLALLLLGTQEQLELDQLPTMPAHTDREFLYGYWGRTLYPYEKHSLEWSQGQGAIYVLEGEEELRVLTDTPNAPEIQRIYQLQLRYYYGRNRSRINLTKVLGLEEWFSGEHQYDFLPMYHPRLTWHGDLNADGHPDLLFYLPNTSECCGGFEEYHLLMSEETEDDGLNYRKVAETRLSPCFGC